MRDFSQSELEALERLNLEGYDSPIKSSPLSKNTIIEASNMGINRVSGNVKSAMVDIGLLERKAEEANGAVEGKENVNGHA
jgi:hypothetical protein